MDLSALQIIFTGCLVAICCGALGCFLILRKMAMVSDAISHAVLPGIVIAFMLGGNTGSFWMLFGAGAMGITTTFLIEFLHKKGKLQTDASIGVTFTWLFAIGVILVSYYAGDTHIDQDCILYGEIAYVPIDFLYTANGTPIAPKAIVVLGTVLLIIVGVLAPFYRQFMITTFDPGFAMAIGISVTLWHYVLMALVSLTTVASFESVGAILVVAFLVVPPATAYLLTSNLKKMIFLSCAFGIMAAVLGYFLAVAVDGSIAGAMASVSGVLFAFALTWTVISKKIAVRSLSQPVDQDIVSAH